MRNFGFRRRRNNIKAYVVSGVLSVVCFAVVMGAFLKLGNMNKLSSKAQTAEESQSAAAISDNITAENGVKELRGVWIASTININFPSKTGLTVSQLKAELDDIVTTADKNGLNAIFFQVRPCADALYKSDVFPSSQYITGKQGQSPDDSFDCLDYLIKAARPYGIEIHAWVNPYRVTMYEKDEALLSADNPAKLHPEYTVKYADGKTYFNPGIPEVRELVVSGVKELVANYPDLAGIHYDDYFYPYPKDNAEFDDDAQYKQYGGGMNKADWRRDNVNKLVKETYDAIKKVNPDCRFGISTFGIWANSSSTGTPVVGSDTKGLECYSDLYCDPLAWIKGKYVDYIAPQDYWSFGTSSSPFDTIARWWNANLDSTGVDLYIGHAAYKSAEYDCGEIAGQVEFSRTLLTYKGSIFYGYEDLKKDTNELSTRLKKLYKEKIYYADPMSNGHKIELSVADGEKTTSSATFITGSSDPAYPVKLNGNAVSRTKGGYFGEYIKLSLGENKLSFGQNGSVKTVSVNYDVKKAAGTSYKTMDSMRIGDTYPSSDTWIKTGDKLMLSCTAPAGSNVSATIGGTTVMLQPTINPPDDDNYMYEYYTGSIMPSGSISDGSQLTTLGTLVFKAERKGESAEKIAGVISQIDPETYVYAEVKKDYTYTKVGPKSEFYDDFLPSSKGMRDYIQSLSEGYYKLHFGGFVSVDEVSIVHGKTLLMNKLLTTGMSVSCTDNTNNKNNTTDLRFGITENIPVDVDFVDGFMRIIMYNTDTSVIPDFAVTANPLVSSVTGSVGSRENVVIYKVKLKNDENFYGFNIVYEDGMMIVKLNNPQAIVAGNQPLSGKRILVDAGHGGTDTGAPGPGSTPEKVLNFNIASRLAVKLRALGAEVIETRTSDTTVSLVDRIAFLNETQPDMSISVHHNSVPNTSNANKARGQLSLYSNNSGVMLAKTVSKTVSNELNRAERPTAYQKLAVARNHRFPSMLIEMCFISNPEEYQWSITAGNYERSAQALADGIVKYYEAQEAYLAY